MSDLKVIFLDVDGVLNRLDRYGDQLVTVPAPGMKGSAIVDLNVVSLLVYTIERIPNLKIVASTTWREFYNKEQLAEIIHIPVSLFHDDWRTIKLSSNRGLEITEWLHRNPEINDYAVVDDNDDGIKVLHGSRFIHTKHTEGLTIGDLQRLIKFTGYRVTKDFRVVTLGGPVESGLIIP